MGGKFQKIVQSLLPFIVLGIAVALLLGIITMFFYVLAWGVLIGALLWLVSLIKDFFFPAKKPDESQGRIIEHNDPKNR